MKKRMCYHCVIRVNRSQKKYLLHQLHQLDYVYKDMYQRCIRKQKDNRVLQKRDLYALLKERHKYDLSSFEAGDIQALLHQLYQQQFLDKYHHFVCTIVSPSLHWHSMPLQEMVVQLPHIPHGMKFHHANLYVRKGILNLKVYYEKREEGEAKILPN